MCPVLVAGRVARLAGGSRTLLPRLDAPLQRKDHMNTFLVMVAALAIWLVVFGMAVPFYLGLPMGVPWR